MANVYKIWKYCPICRVEKSEDDYNLDFTTDDCITAACSDCMSDRLGEPAQILRTVSPRINPKSLIRQEFYEIQGKQCAICGKPEDPNLKLALDHNHETQVYRGLLCDTCNRLLGLAQDNPAILRAAAQYIETRG